MTLRSHYFINKMRAQERWRLEESINLLPSENVTSPDVRSLLASDFGHRYTLPTNAEFSGYFLENSYRGTRITDEIEQATERLACDVFSADYACVKPLSGHIAALIVIVSTTRRGASIASISAENGGYDGYGKGYIPDLFGLRVLHLPFNQKNHNLDTEATVKLIRSNKPRLVILGASFILFPYDMDQVKEACKDAASSLVYDASHVLGLVAGNEFQQPLMEGANILFGSTHKSFFGPQGGLIVTNDQKLFESIQKNLTWKLVDNAHWNRIAALGQSLLELKRFGKVYAKQVVKNAQSLGKELFERDFPIMFEELGYTKSHQLLIDHKQVEKLYDCSMNDLSIRLEKSNIIIDSVARLGVSEITRMGCKERDMSEIAELFLYAVKGRNVKKKVKEFRVKLELSYIFT